MFLRLLMLPVVIWLLAPPGMCICHLPQNLLAHLQGKPEPPDDCDQHHECPCLKKADSQPPARQAACPEPGTVSHPAVIPPSPTWTSPSLTVLAIDSAAEGPPLFSLYVRYRALRC